MVSELTGICSSVSSDIPVVLYLLDNNSFKCADSEGELSAIKKHEDGKHHIPGSLVVAPEVSMEAVVNNLIKLIQCCGTRKVFVLSPLSRYINGPCCSDTEHCLHLADPDAAIRICCNLHRLFIYIRSQLRELPNCVLVNTGDVLAGKANAIPSEILAATATWGPVHGPQAAYLKMASELLSLFSTHIRSKRTREESIPAAGGSTQRSRALSFSDGVSSLSRTGLGSSERFRTTPISYPIPGRYMGQSQGNNTIP